MNEDLDHLSASKYPNDVESAQAEAIRQAERAHLEWLNRGAVPSIDWDGLWRGLDAAGVMVRKPRRKFITLK